MRLASSLLPCRDLVGKIPWSRKWQATPVLLPRKFHGQRSLLGYIPWGCKELDMTEHAHTHTHRDSEDISGRRGSQNKKAKGNLSSFPSTFLLYRV